MGDKWEVAFAEWIDPADGRNPDPAPLAALLRTNEPIPQNIRMALAEAINPVLPIRANWAVRTVWTGGKNNFVDKAIRDNDVGIKVAGAPDVRGAVSKVMSHLSERHEISERRVYKIASGWKETWVKFWGMSLPSRPKRQKPKR
jgi:hypothetical protein